MKRILFVAVTMSLALTVIVIVIASQDRRVCNADVNFSEALLVRLFIWPPTFTQISDL